MEGRFTPARTLMWTAVALALSACAAGAAITPEAQAVVERHVAATGGRETFEAERSVHLRARLRAFGLEGAVEAWSARPGFNASLTTIGPLTLREGTDGETAWRVDQNGKFTRRDGLDLDDARGAAWFQNEMWGLPDQGGGTVTLSETDRDSLGVWSVLEITPPAGKTRRLWFSVRSGLLERSELRDDIQTVTTRLSDYRMIAGRLRPATTRVTVASMPMNDALIELDTLWVNEAIPPSVFAAPASAATPARFQDGGRRAVIPFDYAVRHVWVKASVNGGPLEDFLLDTGASITVLDSTYAARRGLKVQGRIQVPGAGQTGGASFSEVDSIVVGGAAGGVHLGAHKVGVLALNEFLEPFFWRPCAGVLGYDFISRFVMTVDFDQLRLVLDAPDGFEYQGRGQAIPLEMAGNIPVVEAVLDDSLRGRFRLDVGSGSTTDLHRPFVMRHHLMERPGGRLTVMGGGFGGTFSSDLVRLHTMAIGPFSWDQPLVSLSHATAGGLASEDYAGNIGNQVLERFVVTFDYERRRVYLEPGRRFDKKDSFSRVGVQLARVRDVVRVIQVLPRSPGDEAGLQRGDEVRRIDGKPIERWTLDAINAVFEDGRPGDRHSLEIVRGLKKRKLTLTLREMI
jgi:hypothetical protein